jgi:MFS transporter, CP family, cyanate transporter
VRVLLVLALALTGLSMRTAVTSVGAVLDDLESGLHTTSGVSGLITTLPVICFAVIGALAPRLSFRFGAHQLLVASLTIMTLGLVGRVLVSSVWAFIALSVLALTGGAISNVVLPRLVKEHFPDEIGRMTAVYTTALAIGATAGAGLTVPIGDLGSDRWRVGLGSWSALSLLAVLPWLTTLRADRPDRDPAARLPLSAMARSRTAWMLTLFFGFQSFQAYIAFGWFAKFMHAHGVASGTAGAMVAVLSGLSIPVSIVAPNVPQQRQRLAISALSACYLIAYVGMAAEPVGGAWLWMVFAGLGSGTFPLALTMMGLRARTAETTGALSAFTQGIGYAIAGTGPLLFGVLYGVTNSWALPMALLFAALALSWMTAMAASRPTFVDDELAPSSA